MFSEVDIALLNLQDEDQNVRKLGAQTLCRILPLDRLRTIQTALLTEPNPKIAKWIALALGRIGEPSSLACLDAALKATNDHDARSWIEVSRRMLGAEGDEQALKELFKSKDPEATQKAVTHCWENTGLPIEFENSLGDASHHEDPLIRRWAILAMGTTGRLSKVDPVIHGLKDADYLVREWTACTLSRISDPRALDHLIPALTDENARSREWAIKALFPHDDPEIPNILMKAFKIELDPGCREAIILILSRWLKSPCVREFLSGFLVAEPNRVVVVQIIRCSLNSKEGRSDENLIANILHRCVSANDELFWREAGLRLFSSLSKHDQAVAQKVLKSKALQATLGTIIHATSLAKGDGLNDGRKHILEINRRGVLTSVMDEKQDENSVTRIGIIIPLREEFEYFCSAMPPLIPQREPLTNQPYYEATLKVPDGKTAKCIAIFLGRMGTTVAATLTERLLQNFRPEIVVNLGIAAAIDEVLCLTDVLVATEVDMYLEGAKATQSATGLGFEVIPQGDPFKTDSPLCEEFDHLKFQTPEEFKKWQSQGTNDWGEHAKKNPFAAELISNGSVRTAPNVVCGILGSGPFLGAATSFGKWLKNSFNRKYYALDMEAGGVTTAAHYGRFSPRTLIIRGISDFGDERKKDVEAKLKGAAREIAMKNATRLLLTLLGNIDLRVLSAPPLSS